MVPPSKVLFPGCTPPVLLLEVLVPLQNVGFLQSM